MTKKRSTKSALVSSVLALFLCFTMLLGTTYAWFTDSVTSANNIIKSGNLDIELYYMAEGDEDWTKVDENTNVFKKDALWEPGHTEVVKLKIVNEGSLALKYQLGVNVASEVGSTNINGQEFKLSDFIKYGIVEGEQTYTRDTAIAAVDGTAKALNVAYYSAMTTLLPNTETNADIEDIVTMVVYMPTAVNNDANAAKDAAVPTINLGINLFATQATAEEDSFDSSYDKDAWNNNFAVTTADELQTALNNAKPGDVVTLSENINLSETIVIPAAESAASTFALRSAPQAVTLDLNGKEIVGEMHKDNGAVIKNEGILVLKNGTVMSTADNGGSALLNKGIAIVENVTLKGAPNAGESWPSYTVNNTGDLTFTNAKITSYHGAVASYGEGAIVTLNNSEIDMAGIPGFTSHGIYTYSNGAVVINGGVYANKATDQGDTGASVINGAVTVNGGTFSGRIENYYGNPVICGGTFSVNPNAKFIADGYKSNKVSDGLWIVSKENVVVGSETVAVDEALNNGGDVIMAADMTVSTSNTKADSGYNGTTGLEVNGGVLDGNGNTLTVTDANGTWDCAINSNSGTIQNLTVNGAFRGIFMSGADGNVYIDNVIIDKVCYTFNSDAGSKEFGVYISNSTLNGWTSYSDVHKEVVFTNCNFGKGTGGYDYAFCRPYNKSVFENCVFEEGFEFDTSKTSDITFINCYYGDQLITTENAATLCKGETVFFYNGLNGITIN